MEHIFPRGEKTSFDGPIPEDGVLPVKVDAAKAKLVLICANGPANATCGRWSIDLSTPFIWCSQGDSRFDDTSDTVPITATADDPRTNITVLLIE